MHTEIKKALRKHTCKDRKRSAHEPDSDSDFNDSTWRGKTNGTGESTICKKRKLNSSSKTYTYPSPSKAIRSTKIKLSNKLNIDNMMKDKSEKSFSKINDNKVTKIKKSETAK